MDINEELQLVEVEDADQKFKEWKQRTMLEYMILNKELDILIEKINQRKK